MNDPAFRARPLTDSKRKRVEDMPTIETALTGWIPLVDFDQLAPIPLCLICELRDKFRPAHIRDSLAEFGILDHVLDGKRLDADRLVFTDQAGRELVQEIPAAVSYSGMDFRDFLPGFGSILGPFLLLRKPSLCLRQLLLILVEEFRVAYRLASREDHQVFQAQVNPYGVLLGGQRLYLLFQQDGDEVTISAIPGNGDRTRLAVFGQGARPVDIQRVGHLCQGQVSMAPPKGGIGVGRTLLVALLFENRILATPFKEIEKSSIQVPKCLLQRNTRNISKPPGFFLLFELGQGCTQIIVVQALPLLIVGIGFLAQPPVVNIATTPKGLGKNALLFFSRVKPILVGSFLLHVLHASSYLVKRQAGTTQPRPNKERTLYHQA